MNNVSAHRAFSFLRTYGYERVSCSKTGYEKSRG